ncbi:MAG: D-allose transport system permease protein AlsC [Anaerolineales bacterium]|nr:D-allose transport system permease protein AlsC [Anaerolineales bacterium]
MNDRAQALSREGTSPDGRTWLKYGTIVVALIIAVIFPFVMPPYYLQFATDALMFAILASSWNIIGGYTGYPSFGNAVFFGLGAYATGILMTKAGMPFLVGLLGSAAVCVIFAVLIGRPVLRLRGHYFAIGTLGVAEAMREVVINLDITEGNTGMVLPLIRAPEMFYYFMLGTVLLTIAVTAWFTRRRLGYGLVAIREDEDAATTTGVDTTRYKVIAFALSGMFAGIAGGIHAYKITFIEPGPVFSVTLTVEMIVMAVFGGVGTIIGPTIGAILLQIISELLSNYILVLHATFFGLVIIFAIVFTPRGLVDIISGRRRLGLAYFLENVREHRI